MNILVPVSGGKDSQASALLAIDEAGIDSCTFVFNDTGWDHPLTYKHINYMQDFFGKEIHHTSGGKRGKNIIDLIRDVGRFPFGRGNFCTMYLKQYALRDWYKDNLFDGKTRYEFWFGMRQQESVNRAKRYEGIETTDIFDMEDLFPNRYGKQLRKTIDVRLPIVDWSEKEVFDLIEAKGMIRNPLYHEGTNDRVGCYPCMLAGKGVQQAIFTTKIGQERLEIIRQLEEEIGQKYEMYDTDQGSCLICDM